MTTRTRITDYRIRLRETEQITTQTAISALDIHPICGEQIRVQANTASYILRPPKRFGALKMGAHSRVVKK